MKKTLYSILITTIALIVILYIVTFLNLKTKWGLYFANPSDISFIEPKQVATPEKSDVKKSLPKVSIRAASTTSPTSQVSSAPYTMSEESIIRLTNKDRKTDGEKPLAQNTELDKIADAKAKDMVEKQYFAHVSPTGQTIKDLVGQVDYDYLIIGDNLGINFTDPVKLEQSFMASPTHRENILDSNYKDIGVAVLPGQYQGYNTIFVVVVFGVKVKYKK